MDTTPPHKSGTSDAPKPLTLGALADAVEVLRALAGQALEGATALKIVRLSRWAGPFYDQYITLRGALAAQMGTPIPDGKYHITPERVGEYRQQLSQIRAKVINPIDSALCLEVAQLGGMQLTPVAVEALEPFLPHGALAAARTV